MFRVTDNRLKHFVKKSVNQYLEARDLKFHGPLPIGLERTHLRIVRASSRYFATVKADGHRCLCFIFRYFFDNAWRRMVALWDRAGDVYILPKCIFADVYYDGSVLDTELMCTNLLVFDCYATRDVTIVHEKLQDRLRHIKTMLETASTPIPISLKEYACLAQPTNVLNATFASDGIVIVNAGPLHSIQYKWKPNHTVDLQVVYNEDGIVLCTSDNDVLQKVEESKLPQFEYGAHRIVECDVQLNPLRFKPMSARSDKLTANTTLTVNATVKCVEEAIDVHELFQLPIRRVRRC